MIRTKLVCVLSCGMLINIATTANGDHPLTPAMFGTLHKMIQPQPSEEKWLQIPWQTKLWQARQQAAAQGKPILLWEMDGHPLGCT